MEDYPGSCSKGNLGHPGHTTTCDTEELRGNNEIVMKALSYSWKAMDFASHALRRCLPGHLTEFAHFSAAAVALNVVLMSGRMARLLFTTETSIQFVLRECAHAFGMDPQHVKSRGKLLSATTPVNSLHELQPWTVHQLTLILP